MDDRESVDGKINDRGCEKKLCEEIVEEIFFYSRVPPASSGSGSSPAITRWEQNSNLRSLMISVAATESQEINLAGK